jgi:hypothetical protein
MYLIEHAMKDLKGYVCNMVKPEGSKAKGYIVDEALGLCSKYMQGFGQLDGVFGLLMKRRGWPGRYWKACPDHVL